MEYFIALIQISLVFHSLIYQPCHICVGLRDLVLFVQFKKREKHPWKSVNFSKVAGVSLQLH